MKIIIKLIMTLIQSIGPSVVKGLFESKGLGGEPVEKITRAIEKTKEPVEWIESIREETGATGDGSHALDRLLNSALKAEETSAKVRRGFGGAVDVTIAIAKKVVF
jgi:hypothetical protein